MKRCRFVRAKMVAIPDVPCPGETSLVDSCLVVRPNTPEQGEAPSLLAVQGLSLDGPGPRIWNPESRIPHPARSCRGQAVGQVVSDASPPDVRIGTGGQLCGAVESILDSISGPAKGASGYYSCLSPMDGYSISDQGVVEGLLRLRLQLRAASSRAERKLCCLQRDVRDDALAGNAHSSKTDVTNAPSLCLGEPRAARMAMGMEEWDRAAALAWPSASPLLLEIRCMTGPVDWSPRLLAPKDRRVTSAATTSCFLSVSRADEHSPAPHSWLLGRQVRRQLIAKGHDLWVSYPASLSTDLE
ncbi:unnamed protein product [Diplocarpon coronariae]